MDKWSPTNLFSMDKWSLEYSFCPGNRLWRSGNLETKLVGDQLSRGAKFLGPFVQGGQSYGNRLSRRTGSGGPEVRGSNWFGTKCIAYSQPYTFMCLGRAGHFKQCQNYFKIQSLEKVRGLFLILKLRVIIVSNEILKIEFLGVTKF